MPRPNTAQLAYGSVTVVFSTLAMLLLSQTTSGAGIAIIGLCALGIGLLVAVTVPMPKRTRAKAATTVRTNPVAASATVSSGSAGISAVNGEELAARVPVPRARRTERVGGHSLRG